MIREHTHSDKLCDLVMNGKSMYRKVNPFPLTSKNKTANLWLLFKLVWFQFNYVRAHGSADACRNTRLLAVAHAKTACLEPGGLLL